MLAHQYILGMEQTGIALFKNIEMFESFGNITVQYFVTRHLEHNFPAILYHIPYDNS